MATGGDEFDPARQPTREEMSKAEWEGVLTQVEEFMRRQLDVERRGVRPMTVPGEAGVVGERIPFIGFLRVRSEPGRRRTPGEHARGHGEQDHRQYSRLRHPALRPEWGRGANRVGPASDGVARHAAAIWGGSL